MLTGRNITLGVAGGIAAYKAAELVSSLTKKGAKVKVIMTAAAQEFIQPLTFSALSHHSVFTDMFDLKNSGVTHIELAQKTDLLAVAPATANVIAKAATGIADDLLSTVILAASCPVLMCPAMNTIMYQNPVVQQNINNLQQLGYKFVGPNSGVLACGSSGAGRMSEPLEILKAIEQLFTPGDMDGLNILVSAGPTREPIDPVRYLTNRSSGKMGYSIARAAAQRGARVVLVSGPVSLPPPEGVKLIAVETAQQMHHAILKHFPATDVVIKAAAVADYRPKNIQKEKIKKQQSAQLVLELEKNPDILSQLGAEKKHQTLVGFAAETENLASYARAKLQDKNLDLLVANNVSTPGAGFDVDTNIVTIYQRNGAADKLPLMSKDAVAQHILDLLLAHRQGQAGGE